jgi:ribosomal protein L7/L12
MKAKKLPPNLQQQVIELINKGRKVEAVRVVHKAMGWGLADSKDVVDTLAATRKQ